MFKYAITAIGDVIEDAFSATGFTPDDIDWFVPHQANIRIIDGSAKKFGIPDEKVDQDGRAARQYLGRVDPAGPCRRLRRRAHQARRPAASGIDGRRFHMGLGDPALVTTPAYEVAEIAVSRLSDS